MPRPSEFLWYIPNEIIGGHRGDSGSKVPYRLDSLLSHAAAVEQHGWTGALIGTGWGRPDTFTVAAALTAQSKSFSPLIAIKPGYWKPAQFASAAATLDELSGGRVRVNIVSGVDNIAAYGDMDGDQAHRYARTEEFMRLVRRLWTEEDVTFHGEYFQVAGSTVQPRITPRGDRIHPRFYFGGASKAAEHVAASQADVQLFWGEPLDGVAARIDRLKSLSTALDRDLAPLEFGLRITTLIRDTAEEAWAVAETKIEEMARKNINTDYHRRAGAEGQRRLLDLQARGDVVDDNLYTAPGRYGAGGAGTTWLVGSAAEVANSLSNYQKLGISHFILSDTPYLQEVQRQGEQLLPLLQTPIGQF